MGKQNIDIFKFWLLFLIIVISVYFMPFSFNQLVFIVLFGIVFKAKNKDYFWIAFLFLVLDAPGSLLRNAPLNDLKQLPFFSYSSTGSIRFIDLMPAIFLIKAIKKPKHLIVLNKDFKILLILYLLYFLRTFFFNFSINSIYNTIVLHLLSWTLLYSCAKLLSNKDLLKLDSLLFTAVVVAFIAQLTTLATGLRWIDFFKFTSYKYSDLLKAQADITARYISSPYIIFYSLHKAFYYSFCDVKPFSGRYLSVIISISILSILLSATRGWILAIVVTMILIAILLPKQKQFKRILSFSTSAVLIFAVSVALIPPIRTQVTNAYNRFLTIETVIQGDPTIGGTVYRVTDRIPKVMNKYKEHIMFGWSFSDVFWEFRDDHIGHPTILLNVGIIGYIILLFFFIKWLLIIYIAPKRFVSQAVYGIAPKVLAFALFFAMVINSTSHVYWGFIIRYPDKIALVLILTSFNAIIMEKYSSDKIATGLKK